MSSRRWLDWDILGKMALGLAMLAVPVVQWLTTDTLSMRLFVVGGLGVAMFFWGLLSIGDQKNQWE